MFSVHFPTDSSAHETKISRFDSKQMFKNKHFHHIFCVFICSRLDSHLSISFYFIPKFHQLPFLLKFYCSETRSFFVSAATQKQCLRTQRAHVTLFLCVPLTTPIALRLFLCCHGDENWHCFTAVKLQ